MSSDASPKSGPAGSARGEKAKKKRLSPRGGHPGGPGRSTSRLDSVTCGSEGRGTPLEGPYGVLSALLLATAIQLPVPFVPQEKDTCGAAALAMVMGYWGAGGPAPARSPPRSSRRSSQGIRGSRLADFARERGMVAIAFAGEMVILRDHLAKGRPLVVAIDAGHGRLHDVVVVGFDDERGEVIVHDPARGAGEADRGEGAREEVGEERAVDAARHAEGLRPERGPEDCRRAIADPSTPTQRSPRDDGGRPRDRPDGALGMARIRVPRRAARWSSGGPSGTPRPRPRSTGRSRSSPGGRRPGPSAGACASWRAATRRPSPTCAGRWRCARTPTRATCSPPRSTSPAASWRPSPPGTRSASRRFAPVEIGGLREDERPRGPSRDRPRRGRDAHRRAACGPRAAASRRPASSSGSRSARSRAATAPPTSTWPSPSATASRTGRWTSCVTTGVNLAWKRAAAALQQPRAAAG